MAVGAAIADDNARTARLGTVRLRGRAIEMLFCGFQVDLVRLRDEFGDFARLLEAPCAAAVRAFPGAVRSAAEGIALDREAPLLAQRVACSRRAGGIRLAPHAFNTDEDLDRFFHVLDAAPSCA